MFLNFCKDKEPATKFPEREAGAISEKCAGRLSGGDHAEPNVFGNKNESQTPPPCGGLDIYSTLNIARISKNGWEDQIEDMT